jgi:hypothetical protein
MTPLPDIGLTTRYFREALEETRRVTQVWSISHRSGAYRSRAVYG